MNTIRRNRLWDVAVLFPVAVLIAGFCYFVSRHRIFWSDELFGWMLVSDPSWRHMLHAWNLGADGGGMGFYVLARLWLRLFGHHALAYRAFSATGVFTGFAFTWFSLRRFYRPALAAIALFVVWFDSRICLWQIVQTRFYGMLLGMAALSLYMSLRSAEEVDRGVLRKSTLAWTFAANLALVSTHPFGAAYCVLVFSAALADDLLSHRRRFGFYLATVLPFTVLIFSRTALLNSARVGKPWFWTTRPSFHDLHLTYIPDYAPILFFIALALALIVFASMLWKSQRITIAAGLVHRRSILIPALLFLLAPAILWCVSRGATSYFVDRYFCPFLIGVAVLGTELLSHIFARRFSRAEPMPLLFAVALAAFCFYSVIGGCMVPYGQLLPLPPLDFTGGLAAMLPRNEPIVIQRADIFDLMVFYRGAPDLPMFLPLDWDLALSPDSPRWLVSATHEMENWRSAGYYSNQIVDSSAFLRSHTRFVVVADGITPWFQRRIATQPGWKIQKLGNYENGLITCTIWQVTR